MRFFAVCAALTMLLGTQVACGGGGDAGAGKAVKAAKKDAKKDAKQDAKADAKADTKADPAAAGDQPKDGILVMHTVKDFAKWKEIFDADEARRKDMGVLYQAVMQEDGNPNNVVLGFMVADPAKVKEAMGSPDLKAKMQEAGVEGEPEITFLTMVDRKDAPEGTEPKAAMIGRHKVKDFAAWKKVYDGGAEIRTKGGIVGEGVMQAADDPNDVVVYHDAMDMDTLKKFTEMPELKEKMKEAGVDGEPKFWFLNVVEEKMFMDDKAGGAPAPAGDAKAADAKAGDAKADDATK